MKKLSPILPLFILSCSTGLQSVSPPAVENRMSLQTRIEWPTGLPKYSHIVIVVEENKDYDQIIGNPSASYINGTLKAEGADLTQMYAEEHNSEGNYFWLFSGSNQGVGFIDTIPSRTVTASNLGEALIVAKNSFKGYAEDLPEIDSTVTTAGHYARKHVPWVSFSNIPHGETGEPAVDSFNLRFKDFPRTPEGYRNLPTVSFVIPNLTNDMHDGAAKKSIPVGDCWLKKNLDDYYQWAKKNNSLLILTFDEDSHGGFLARGLTDPADPQMTRRNRIVTILAGAHILHGEYREGRGVTHINLLRTLESMYGLGRSGAQQPWALKAGISDDYVLTDIFDTAP